MILVKRTREKTFFKFCLTLGVLGVVFYPIFVDPFLDPQKYKEKQSNSRKYIRKEDIQPGNMNVWRNPFADNLKKEKQQELNKGKN